ncbi:MAG: hypothetical protein CMJ30_06480 [Phycisphaerae bacterium]|nr:hypothetical protein [Phycisphaerae bacterium]
MLVGSALEDCFLEMEYSMSSLSMIALSLLAQDGAIRDALATVDDETREFHEHIVVLSSQWMDGRLPGTPGMERAKDYFEHHLRAVGLQPAVEPRTGHPGGFRHPFSLGTDFIRSGQAMATVVDGELDEFQGDTDFTLTGMGAGTDGFAGPAVFVGYGLEVEDRGYTNFSDDTDLSGKVAVCFRFEPMDENGESQWSSRRWSRDASFANKIAAVGSRNPDAIVILNPPDCSDDRAQSMIAATQRLTSRFPIYMCSIDAGDRLLKALDAEGRSAADFRALADQGAGPIALTNGMITLEGTIEEQQQWGENVVGLLPGRGELAAQAIVVGGHLDHLGKGDFGSRRGAGQLHPGADDNASGSAGILMIAKSMAQVYEDLPEGQPARSILFVGFSAEESGLNGSRAFVDDPIWPLSDVSLMTNFDMIGRAIDGKVQVAGAETGVGLREIIETAAETSPLDVTLPSRSPGASDHTSFLSREIPALFGITDNFHDDYHTPDDTSDKINFVAGMQMTRLFADIIKSAALLPDRTSWIPRSERAGRRRAGSDTPRRASIRVRFGIRPDSYDEDLSGILVGGVTEGGSAELAGVQAGDVLVGWNESSVEDVRGWMSLLREHEPGDVVAITVVRDGKQVQLKARLQGRDDEG